jgi:pSer/pThr/pTyr-binding forkhead associated (FHA) protein
MKTSCPNCGALLRLDKQTADRPPSQVRCWMCRWTWNPEVDDSTGDGPTTVAATPSSPRDRIKDARIDPSMNPETASLALPEDKVIRICVVAGASQGMEYDLSRPLVTIGRLKGDADMEIDDPEVSAVHCAVEVRRDAILLHDLRSTNGTYLGESRVFAARLDETSKFRIGSTFLQVKIVPKEDTLTLKKDRV